MGWSLIYLASLLSLVANASGQVDLAPFSAGLPLLSAASTTDDGPQPIVNGNQAPSNPGWVARMFISTPSGLSGCGGTLISNDWIISSAHCFYPACNASGTPFGQCNSTLVINNSSSIAYVGGTDLSQAGNFSTSLYAEVWINPNYEGTTVVNSAYDIALVKLASPGAMTALTKAQWNADPNIPAIGMDVISWGWGICQGPNCAPTIPPSNKLPYNLQYTGPPGLPVVTPATCSATYITQPYYCLKGLLNGLAASICQGDSGGPNSMTIGSNAVMMGTTTFSLGDCQATPVPSNVASGILRTSNNAAWIRTVTGVAPATTTCGQLTVNTTLYNANSCNNITIGGTCTVACAQNSSITATFTCTTGLNYTGTLPTCSVPTTCPAFTQFGYDTSACNNIPANGNCVVRCSSNSSVSSTFSCLSNLTWSGALPSCPNCGQLNLDDPNVNTTLCNNIIIGSSCTVSCVNDPEVTEAYTCNIDGTYSGTLPDCSEPSPCGTLGDIGAAYDTSDCVDIPDGDTCEVTCKTNPSISSTYTCSNGDYIGTKPVCSSSCTSATLTLPPDIVTSNCDSVASGKTCMVFCGGNPGASSRYRCVGGVLVGTPPSCPKCINLSELDSSVVDTSACTNTGPGEQCQVNAADNPDATLSTTWIGCSTSGLFSGFIPPSLATGGCVALSNILPGFDTTRCTSVRPNGMCRIACKANPSVMTVVFGCGNGLVNGPLPSDRCPQAQCGSLTLPPQYDTSACQDLYSGSSCTVRCIALPSQTSQFTCTATGEYFGNAPSCGSLSTCGTLNLGPVYDTSQCQNVPIGRSCPVTCASGSYCVGGPTVTYFKCCRVAGGSPAYQGTPPQCRVRGPSNGGWSGMPNGGYYTCRTPWGIMSPGQSTRVSPSNNYCARYVRGRYCQGMWVKCQVGGWFVKCIY